LADEHGLAKSDGSGGSEQLPMDIEVDAQGFASPEDVAAFRDRFLRLLERRTAIYTMGDSTSVPKHVAIDILLSVCFVLGIDPDQPEVPDRLLTVDLEDEFRRRLAQIECKVELSGKLWQDVCATMPPIPNTALQHTVASIGDFPKRYDFRSMAHEVPCVFDYPLCHPVPDTLLGVDYINEYLRRLLVESDFLRRFELDACIGVLERSSPDYVDLLVNLYEPIATNAIGRAVIGKSPMPLRVSEEERVEIVARLGSLDETGRARVLLEAALRVSEAVGVDDDGAREYLRALVPELLPRIEAGLVPGELRGVFV